jgi:ABC-type phosphate/phosphonate transport system ATPase subunit
MSAIKLQAVEKWFGDVQVIKGVDLEIANGESVVLIGASASGKTLLMKCSGLCSTARRPTPRKKISSPAPARLPLWRCQINLVRCW